MVAAVTGDEPLHAPGNTGAATGRGPFVWAGAAGKAQRVGRSGSQKTCLEEKIRCAFVEEGKVGLPVGEEAGCNPHGLYKDCGGFLFLKGGELCWEE